MGHVITLTINELAVAANVGARRQLSAIEAGLRDKHGAKQGWQIHIEGAAGEIAVAKFLNRHWSCSVNTFRSEPDVSTYEVRTRSEDWHDLIIRPDDKDESPYILVTGQAPYFTVQGWLYAREGKVPDFWKAPGGRPPAWFVPQGILRELPNKEP